MQLIIKLIAMSNLQNKFTGIGLTYDDVLLVPSYSEFLPNQVDLKTKFSRKINLNIPLIKDLFKKIGIMSLVDLVTKISAFIILPFYLDLSQAFYLHNKYNSFIFLDRSYIM